ncbi:MAG: glycosyltransferase family 2 protein [Flavobacteriales bacterium]|nr:glycosyltransferase family 2 protein [Flavobacteriales bacterium]
MTQSENSSVNPLVAADSERANVSVIVPCFNVAHLVEGAIRSALHGQGDEVELVAVDDGSTDGTLAVLHRIEQESGGRLRVIAQPNRGACVARNAGLAATTGAYVQFLDADDVLLPGKIPRQRAIMEQKGADLLAGAYRVKHENGLAPEMVVPWPGEPWEALVRTRLGATCANLFRRSAIDAVGGWDEAARSSQDYELMFRLLKGDARVAVDKELGAEVLKRSTGSISRTALRDNWLRYLDLRTAIREHLRRSDPQRYAAVIRVADQYLFMVIRDLARHDRRAAFEAFDRLLPGDFMPEVSPATTRAYVQVYRYFGFRVAQGLSALMATMRKQ